MLLVLSRKVNESIKINDDITVMVVEIRGDKVRLGVEHPRGAMVQRHEVYEAMQRPQPGDGSRPLSSNAIQRRIDELQSEIRELEARLTS